MLELGHGELLLEFRWHELIVEMNVIDVEDADVAAERLGEQHKLPVLDLDLVDEVVPLGLHPFEQVSKEKLLVEDPRGLVSDLSDGDGVRVTDEQDIVDALLRLQLMERILDVVGDIAEPESLLG